METYVVRMWLPDRAGALGQVASRIGAVRGDVAGIEAQAGKCHLEQHFLARAQLVAARAAVEALGRRPQRLQGAQQSLDVGVAAGGLVGVLPQVRSSPVGVVRKGAKGTIAISFSSDDDLARLLEKLGLKPILELDMRLGEGSGAALAAALAGVLAPVELEQAATARTRRGAAGRS